MAKLLKLRRLMNDPILLFPCDESLSTVGSIDIIYCIIPLDVKWK